MKEHSLFLLAGFPSKETEFIQRADRFREEFESGLRRTVELADGIVRESVLNSREIVTEYTQQAECQTITELERRGRIFVPDLKNLEIFWNQIMMEHAQFIRGLLDPTECELIETANTFAGDYCELLEEAKEQDRKAMNALTAKTLEITKQYQQFKTAGTQGITGCEIRSIILPLLADHVLREANHYLRILEYAQTGGGTSC